MNLQFSLPVSVLREGNRFIAYTPALDLSTSANTYEKAKKRLEEAVQIFFEETTEHDTLDQVLGDLGWKKVKKEWKPPVVVSQESEEVRVPA